MSKTTIKEICCFFWELESKENLYEWSLRDVYVWPIVRMKIYYLITNTTKIFDDPHPKPPKKLQQKCKDAFKILAKAILQNPFLGKTKKKLLIPHPRKIAGQDIYTKKVLEENIDSSLVIDSCLSGGEQIEGSKSVDLFRIIAFFVAEIASRFFKLTKEEHQKIATIKHSFEESFVVSLELEKIFIASIFYFKVMTYVWKLLLKKKQIQHVYCTVSYTEPNLALTAAARSIGIRVSEYQHGTITPYHLGYSYPKSPDVPYQPDELCCFGVYWYKHVDFAKSITTKVTGAPHIEAIKNLNIEKKANTFFFSSQGVIGQKLFLFAQNVAKRLPNYQITFNLHPSEYRELYPNEKTLPSNMRILSRPENIFEIIAAHEYQAGVFSTTLFEGIVLGTKIVIIDLPGQEYMTPLIQNKDAIFVKTVDEFILKFRHAPKVSNINDYYAQISS